jgi:hypothetical protein
MKPTAGRIVNYVISDGKVRPFLIVEPWGLETEGAVNGLLFVDGPNDGGKIGVIGDVDLNKNPVIWKSSVPYQAAPESGKLTPFTWHWPARV